MDEMIYDPDAEKETGEAALKVADKTLFPTMSEDSVYEIPEVVESSVEAEKPSEMTPEEMKALRVNMSHSIFHQSKATHNPNKLHGNITPKKDAEKREKKARKTEKKSRKANRK